MELHNSSRVVVPMKAISFKKRRNRNAALEDDVSDIIDSTPFCRSACNTSGRDRSSLGILNSELRAMFHNMAEAEKARLSRKDSKKKLFASMIKPLSFRRRRQKSSGSS